MTDFKYEPEKADGIYSAGTPRLRSPQPTRSNKQTRTARYISAVLFLFTIVLLFRNVFVCDHHYNPAKGLIEPEDELPASKKVPLEAHIMSKCPDARDCLQKLVVPTMEEVSSKVDFRLSYIGRVDNDSDEIYCMHGPSECLGNMIQLCAARIYPDPKLYLGFANCMTSNYSDIPNRDLIEQCALEHAVDFQRINKCISDEGHGTELLRDSVERSRENNVTKSCTIRLNNQFRCIRDGGKWYDCEGGSEVSDLVADINALYNQ